ncbi:hypothetical protein COT62_01580 [Candidatus Roizmanbacteria bacterium CG09_land_8_20_14_0_10_41_9]|uniref:Uncharacterized protein n=1 Tax=Candidatus Roizmanbacteria bacterium CG09_land_8_20_14_0_10_41_9 TaxID=1974850 RepID=A0A2H0WT39_9BACT|nr:MAG: hypothetical protein COT62_01580 [Candidatus Roizmanbacteria bacterium CG09_land_8_20_14_0_10_41_9]
MTLTELSYNVRKSFPFVIIFFLVFMILFYSVKLLLLYSGLNQPAQPVYTDTKFGKIKTPVISGSKTSSTTNYILDTIEGQPTTATLSANIYLVPPITTQLNYREKVYLIAKMVGFNTETSKYTLSNRTAVFSDDKQRVNIDVANFNFDYEYSYAKDPLLFTNTQIPSNKDIEEKARDFLKSVGRYPDELSTGKVNIVYHNYNATANTLFVTKNPAQANVVEVDFYRPDIDGFPVVSPEYFTSQNYVIMVFKQSTFKVIKAQVSFFEKSDDQVGVYPLRNGDAAFADLKAGNGYVISGENKPTVTIKKMFLGYHDLDSYQNYLEPVYIFLGENDFVAYVPAVEKDWLEE